LRRSVAFVTKFLLWLLNAEVDSGEAILQRAWQCTIAMMLPRAFGLGLVENYILPANRTRPYRRIEHD
jgi:hypothetical protein